MNHHRHLLPLLLALPLLACKFDPRVPEGVVTCAGDVDCPAGLLCSRSSSGALGRCCRDGVCPTAGGPATPAPGKDAGPATRPTGDGGTSTDAEITLPPAMPGTGPAVPTPEVDGGAPDRAGGDATTAAPAVSCTPSAGTPPPPAPDRQTYCTFQLGDRYLVMGIDVVTDGDPVTTRAHAACWTEPRPLAATTAAPGRRPLPPATLDEMMEGVRLLRARCDAAGGRVVGAVAGAWARGAPELTALQARLRADAGLDLVIPSEVQELAFRYLGATRNRRGRVVFSDWAAQADVMFWPPTATAPTRYVVPISYEQAAAQYFTSPSYAGFEDARRALRDRLQTEMRALTDDLRGLIAAGTLQPGVVVGPTDPTVLLALKGQLRDPTRGWDPPDSYRRKLADATVATSPYGRVYGVVLPPELDAFFPTITARDFTQLRTEPIRAAYGEHVMLTTTLLELIAEEGRGTEFAFVFTNSHFGFLFSKLAAPMAP